MNSTFLSYSGKLVLETDTRSVVKRNHGTSNLFRLFSVILCKEPFNTLSLPAYFMLYNSDPQEIVRDPDVFSNTSKTLLKQFVNITSQSLSKDNVFEATFISTIDSSMLVSKDFSRTDKLTLALISGDKRSILAAVEFDSDTYSIVCNGGQTFVKWIMSISNADDITATAIASLLEEE